MLGELGTELDVEGIEGGYPWLGMVGGGRKVGEIFPALCVAGLFNEFGDGLSPINDKNPTVSPGSVGTLLLLVARAARLDFGERVKEEEVGRGGGKSAMIEESIESGSLISFVDFLLIGELRPLSVVALFFEGKGDPEGESTF